MRLALKAVFVGVILLYLHDLHLQQNSTLYNHHRHIVVNSLLHIWNISFVIIILENNGQYGDMEAFVAGCACPFQRKFLQNLSAHP